MQQWTEQPVNETIMSFMDVFTPFTPQGQSHACVILIFTLPRSQRKTLGEKSAMALSVAQSPFMDIYEVFW